MPATRITLREVSEQQERLLVQRGLVQPVASVHDAGLMVTVWLRHGVGYCATARRDAQGRAEATRQAHAWAERSEASGLFADLDLHALLDEMQTAEVQPMADVPPLPPRSNLIELLRRESLALHAHADIVNWAARLTVTRTHQRLWFDDRLVSEARTQFVEPNLEVTALRGGIAQTRTLGGQYNGFCQQGGFEVIRPVA
jgi:predicted Zn-dependent protease